MTEKYELVTGDWINGSSNYGELVYGYIQAINEVHSKFRVYVVKSDNEKIIGKSIWIESRGVKKLPVLTTVNEQQLLALIDLALLTKDEQWFLELSSELASIRQKSKDRKSKIETISNENGIGNSLK
ncbi:IDEAL domain-containing protein [Bacillus sp. 03113]|uniref:IDEAL domain-containing protein n=1 Tax=Bacillus sp. 03113 TaxID=2578211 RepID=UPI00114323C8|nr:IDEAL domain-containing protein [Bacillus sp. 03113]